VGRDVGIPSTRLPPRGGQEARLDLPARRWRRLDWSLTAFLVVFTVVTRWLQRSRYLHGWDSTSFALALHEYDVAAQQPHAPGYPVYVVLGRLLLPFTADANEALVAEGILFSALAVALLYGLVREFAPPTTAFVTAFLFSVAPVFLFNGLIALSYTSEAAASVGIAWLAWRVRTQPTWMNAPALALLLGLAAGLRQSLLLFLAPLVVWAILRRPWDARKIAASAGAGAVALLAWAVPMVWATSGGWEGYRSALRIQGGWVVLQESVLTHGWEGLQDHAARLGFYLRSESEAFLPVLALVAAFVGATRWRAGPARMPPTRLVPFFVLWITPSLLFYLLVFSGWDRGPTGYILVLLPALYAGAILLLDHVVKAAQDRPRHPWVAKGSVAAVPILLVLSGPILLSAWGPWVEDEVRAHDEWAMAWEGLREEFPSNETAILTFYSWYHVKWYFPEYVTWGYFPIPRGQQPPDWFLVLETRNHRDDVLYYDAHARGPDQTEHPVPSWVRRVVIFDFQLAGEGGETSRLREDVNVEEASLSNGWRLLYFEPLPEAATIEKHLRPLASQAG
jgi:hypothetical protein